MIVLIIFHSLVIVSLIVLGVIFKKGKGLSLIAGYNTASEIQKRKTDEKALLSFMSKTMFLLGGSFVIVLLSDIFPSIVLLIIGLALFFSIAIFSVIYITVSKKFRND